MILPSKQKSSSGGHTILNGSGSAMNQRAGLQFSGLDVTDDSVNDKTVVTLPTPNYVDEQFNASTTYSKGMTCIAGNKRYEYINPTPTAGNAPPNVTYWSEKSVASELKEWEKFFGMNPLVPQLSSNTSELIYSSQYSAAFAAWHAFDRNESSEYASQVNTTNWIGYHFSERKVVNLTYVYTDGASYLQSMKIQYSDNGSNWYDATPTVNITGNTKYYQYSFGAGAHYYWRVFITNSQSDANNLYEVQFYGA